MTFFLPLLSRSWAHAGAGERKTCTCPGASELRVGSGARRRKGGSIPQNPRGRSAGAGQVTAPSPPRSSPASGGLDKGSPGGEKAQRGDFCFLFEAPLPPYNGRGGRRSAQLPRLCPNPLGAGSAPARPRPLPRLSLPQLRTASLFSLILHAFLGGQPRCSLFPPNCLSRRLIPKG